MLEAESGKARQVHVTAIMLAPRDEKPMTGRELRVVPGKVSGKVQPSQAFLMPIVGKGPSLKRPAVFVLSSESVLGSGGKFVDRFLQQRGCSSWVEACTNCTHAKKLWWCSSFGGGFSSLAHLREHFTSQFAPGSKVGLIFTFLVA